MTGTVKIDDNTWSIEDGFVRCFVLKGTEKAVLIDSGANCRDAKEVAENLCGMPVILINTHGDVDHVSGTAAFDEIYISEADYNDCNIASSFPETALRAVKDGETFELGGRTLEIVSIPGHTLGSIAILDVEARRIFAGDSVQNGNIFMFGKNRSAKDLEISLKKLADMSSRFDTVVASHGEMLLPGDYVQKVLEAWEDVLAGKLEYKESDMHGMTVKLYKGEYCGFLCK